SLFVLLSRDTATTQIYTLSLHDALPISFSRCFSFAMRMAHAACSTAFTPSHGGQKPMVCTFARLTLRPGRAPCPRRPPAPLAAGDRKSTRLNSSHVKISYAVFCLKKKNK